MDLLASEGRQIDTGKGAGELVLDEPVFVLTCGRSGSTLLRMILDAHPDLACPPELNIAKVCAQLRDIWMTLEPDSNRDGLSEAARQSIRQMVNSIFTSYLTRRGKLRWCEKSLFTSRVAEKFLDIFEKAKFICLYRHVMDVVSSGLDASPWGLVGYGFDQYASGSGNSVEALVGYWLDGTMQTLEFEEKHPDRCLRVYYEELVTAPEATARSIFEFIGVEPLQDIAARAFATDGPAESGPGDYKIWSSGTVHARSLGKGIRIPASLISPAQANAVSYALGKLGYTLVDQAWQLSACPPALLVRPAQKAGQEDNAGLVLEGEAAGGQVEQPAASPESAWAPESDPRIALFDALDAEISARAAKALANWPTSLAVWDAVAIVAYSLDMPRVAQAWRIDLAGGAVTSDVEPEIAALDVQWLFTAEAEVWESILAGTGDFATLWRSGQVRYISKRMLAEDFGTNKDTDRSDLSHRAMARILGISNGAA